MFKRWRLTRHILRASTLLLRFLQLSFPARIFTIFPNNPLPILDDVFGGLKGYVLAMIIEGDRLQNKRRRSVGEMAVGFGCLLKASCFVLLCEELTARRL